MKIEKVLLFMFVIGFIFKVLDLLFGSTLVVFSLSLLAIIYFIGSFYFFKDKNTKKGNLTLSLICGFLFSISIIGILFKIQSWKNNGLALLLGFICSAISLSMIYYFSKRNNDNELKKYYSDMSIRAFIIFITCVICQMARIYH